MMVNYALMYHMSSWDFVTTALRRGVNSAHWKPVEPRLGRCSDLVQGLSGTWRWGWKGAEHPEKRVCPPGAHSVWFTSLAWVMVCIVFPNRFML